MERFLKSWPWIFHFLPTSIVKSEKRIIKSELYQKINRCTIFLFLGPSGSPLGPLWILVAINSVAVRTGFDILTFSRKNLENVKTCSNSNAVYGDQNPKGTECYFSVKILKITFGPFWLPPKDRKSVV